MHCSPIAFQNRVAMMVRKIFLRVSVTNAGLMSSFWLRQTSQR